MTALLEAKDLKKSYPEAEAVRGVSFAIPRGVCFGLLGPNGAGKTTTVEMLEGILAPSSGSVAYRGQALGPRFRQEAGMMFQSTALQDFLTVGETLDLFASFYAAARSRQELIERCALGEFLGRDTRRLSGGQRQRLLLAIALVNDPLVLFLDEPTTGLDPQSRRNFWDLAHRIKAEGKTLVLTTHYMEEAHELCDEIAIMDHGRIIAAGAPRDLLDRHFQESVLILPAAALEGRLRAEDGLAAHPRNGQTEIFTRDVNAAIQVLLQRGAPLDRLQVRTPTLEDLFLHLTGRELRH